MTIAIPRLDRTTAAERGLTLADFLVPISVGERLNARAPAHPADRDRRPVHLPDRADLHRSDARAPDRPDVRRPDRRRRAGCSSRVRGSRPVRPARPGRPPFFAEGKGGSAVILGATGGYLIGFIVAGAVVGRLAELGWDRHIGGAIGMMLIGSVLIYAIGLPWLAVVLHLSPADTIAAGLTPFIAWDVAKLAVAAGIFPTAWWLIGRRPDDR